MFLVLGIIGGLIAAFAAGELLGEEIAKENLMSELSTIDLPPIEADEIEDEIEIDEETEEEVSNNEKEEDFEL